MTAIRQIDDIYSGASVIHNDDGTFECPICNKTYKQRKSAQNHLDKQSCHSVYDIFGGSDYEKTAFDFYCNIQAQKNRNARPTIKSFRKSPLYKNTVMYVVSCMANDVDAGLMYSFLDEIVGFHYPNAIMKNGQEMKWVVAYRAFIHNNPQISNSKEFYEQYEEVLLDDPDFLIQSIERAKLSLGFIERKKKILRVVDNLPMGHKARMLDVCKIAEESKW